MTQEEKQLLLKDLCARLPYRLKFQSYHSECGIEGKGTFDFEIGDDATLSKLKDLCESGNNKPYLRSMSNMTEKERKYLQHHINECFVDYCNEHYLDYRGLIPKGLALEAPKDMYKTE